jgi:GNAT superfamily N-acetyltransferase
VFAAAVAGEVIGWVHVSLHPTLASDSTAEILGLVVDWKWRGQGVGRQLMYAAEAWACAKGCQLMSVRSRVTRADAHSFYQRLGYQVIKASLTFAKRLAEKENGSEA